MRPRFMLALVGAALVAATLTTIGLVAAQSGAPYAITRSAFTGGGNEMQSGGSLRLQGAVGEAVVGTAIRDPFAAQFGVLGDSATGPSVRGRLPMLATDGVQR